MEVNNCEQKINASIKIALKSSLLGKSDKEFIKSIWHRRIGGIPLVPGSGLYEGLKRFGYKKENLQQEKILFNLAWLVILINTSDLISDDVKAKLIDKLFLEVQARFASDRFSRGSKNFSERLNDRVQAYLKARIDAQQVAKVFLSYAYKDIPCFFAKEFEDNNIPLGDVLVLLQISHSLVYGVKATRDFLDKALIALKL